MITIVAIDPEFDRWQELLNLILSSFAYMNGKIEPPSSALTLTVQSLQQMAKDEIGFVALDGESIVGCIFCREELPDTIYVGKLAVSPDVQGKGIGRALLAKAESLAKRVGCKQLRLHTRIELINNHAAFGAWGFEKTAERSHHGFDRVTYIEMRKTLA